VVIALVMVNDLVFILIEVVLSLAVLEISITGSASMAAETAVSVVVEATVVIIVKELVLYKVADSSNAEASAKVLFSLIIEGKSVSGFLLSSL